ncbi:hypothetical protein PF327_09290 [Sulfurovum sp. XTW-4]|uniref:O-Antigen ligase n=1 Tax=Sulfurovum xiamenensis TaxID=3019066 RepID=A0ABT7QTH4_9BACT|nr:hypothetical protein [Sulfurovum xiamenensis]MDM5264388.1 hypothetical protein [Sulfurovum xiamenensis]
MIINKRTFTDYSILTLFIAMSGVPAFKSKLLTVLEFSVLVLIFILRRKSFDVRFLFFFILIIGITLLQALEFQFFSLVTNFGLLIMVLSAYLIVKILDDKFILYYINILYYIAIVSLVFFIPFTLFPSIASFFTHSITPLFDRLHSPHDSFIFYNITYKEGYLKNSGPFWEPGAYTGYLIIAYVFNFFRESVKMTKKNIVFLLTIFTTISTTAYMTIFIFLFLIYYEKFKNIVFKASMTTVVILIGIYAYNSFDFLGEKIERQIKFAQTMGIQKSNDTQRFLSILRDMEDLKGHELIGRGGHDKTRYDLAPTDKLLQIRTVGITDVLVRVGIIVFIIMFYFLYRSICIYLLSMQEKNKIYCIAIFLSIIFTLISETYFLYPMYWSLLFLQFIYGEKENEKSRIVYV